MGSSRNGNELRGYGSGEGLRSKVSEIGKIDRAGTEEKNRDFFKNCNIASQTPLPTQNCQEKYLGFWGY
jgi:hypothetical protein